MFLDYGMISLSMRKLQDTGIPGFCAFFSFSENKDTVLSSLNKRGGGYLTYGMVHDCDNKQ
jgi:hypothetical protein